MTQEVKKITKGDRPKRTPIGKKGRLTVSECDPNRAYRFVNDKDSRVELFKENGWEVELAANHRIGDRRVDSSSVAGSAARVSVGLGDNAVLMSIPKEWYEEDQVEKAKLVDATEQTIKEKALQSHGGKFEISRN